MVLWELLTCEIPYRDVDNSAIIYGVGSSSLHLPIPSTCPDGFRLIVQMCWNSKPRNRPSFKYILMHLDIAAVEIRSTPPETYFKTQVRTSRMSSRLPIIVTYLENLLQPSPVLLTADTTFNSTNLFCALEHKQNESRHLLVVNSYQAS